MKNITDIFSGLTATSLDCGLTIIEDGHCYSVMQTSDIEDWIEEHGDAAIDDSDGYTAFCDAVDCIASTNDLDCEEVAEAVEKAEEGGRDASDEVAAELPGDLERCERCGQWVCGDDCKPCLCDDCESGVASIYDADGDQITTGLQVASLSDEARKVAADLAAEHGTAVELHDSDGVWLVHRDGRRESHPAGRVLVTVEDEE